MATVQLNESPYTRSASSGIYLPQTGITHREEEYDSDGFTSLHEMQSRHFWYLGRFRFLFRAFLKEFSSHQVDQRKIRAVDLGGGCGGWVHYLNQHVPDMFSELALADSSLKALALARPVVGPEIDRYQVDLLHLEWENRWDVAFLLDVLEHIPKDVETLQEIARALKPGGLLFVATPALKFFWSDNDELNHHVHRYSRKDYQVLAEGCGLELKFSRYFMFFLSPLLYLSRRKTYDLENMSREQTRELFLRTHRVPAAPVNQVLRLIFSMETPLGLWIPFPWGTSLLAVFRKPIRCSPSAVSHSKRAA